MSLKMSPLPVASSTKEEKSAKKEAAVKRYESKEIPSAPGTLSGITHTRCKIAMLHLGLRALQELDPSDSKAPQKSTKVLNCLNALAHFLDEARDFNSLKDCIRGLENACDKQDTISAEEFKQINKDLQDICNELPVDLQPTPPSAELVATKFSKLQAELRILQENKDIHGVLPKFSAQEKLGAWIIAQCQQQVVAALASSDSMAALLTLGTELQNTIAKRPHKSKTELNSISFATFSRLLGTLASEVATHAHVLATLASKTLTIGEDDKRKSSPLAWDKTHTSALATVLVKTGVSSSTPLATGAGADADAVADPALLTSVAAFST
ncbi:hypothetical protein BH10PSE19_BH10PSE19_08790 [soil metagenome]